MTARHGRYPTHLDGQGPTATIAPPLEQTEEDTALLERLAEDWAVPCEFRPRGRQSDPCGAAAAWWIICRECGFALAWCEPHRAEQTAILASPIAIFILCVCDRCDAVIPAARWQDLYIVEPLGVRRGT